MEARGDDEVADGQKTQATNANACPYESRDERSNGNVTSAPFIVSFNMWHLCQR